LLTRGYTLLLGACWPSTANERKEGSASLTRIPVPGEATRLPGPSMTEFACNCQPLASRLARRAASLTQQASSSAACARLQHAQRAPRRARGALRCSAGMGIGFRDREAEDVVQTPELLLAESGIRVPKAAYGLSVRQIAALGLAGGESALKLGEPSPVRQTREVRSASALCFCAVCLKVIQHAQGSALFPLS